MASPPAQPLLGRRVKALRLEAGITLQQLSERSGVSVSALSKIENGHSRATFDTVLKTARGLGVLFDDLLEDGQHAGVSLNRLVVTRADEAEEYPTEIYNYFAYGTEMLQRRLMPLLIAVKTHSVPDFVDWSTHEGEEFILVLEGEIDLHTEHYRPQRLRTGDAAYFDSLMRHAFVAASPGVAKILSVSLADARAADSSLDVMRSAENAGSSRREWQEALMSEPLRRDKTKGETEET